MGTIKNPTPDEALREVFRKRSFPSGTDIRDLVNSWLEDMRLDEDGHAHNDYGAVNWADLQVVDVIRCKSALTDQEWIAVVIEEASPDCRLPGALYEKLKRLYPGLEFEVRCEW